MYDARCIEEKTDYTNNIVKKEGRKRGLGWIKVTMSTIDYEQEGRRRWCDDCGLDVSGQCLDFAPHFRLDLLDARTRSHIVGKVLLWQAL